MSLSNHAGRPRSVAPHKWVTVRMPTKLFAAIDACAKQRSAKRKRKTYVSDIVRDALERYLREP